MSGARCGGRIAARDQLRPCRAEAVEMAFELGHQAREQVVAANGVLHDADLGDGLGVEQERHGVHGSLIFHVPRPLWCAKTPCGRGLITISYEARSASTISRRAARTAGRNTPIRAMARAKAMLLATIEGVSVKRNARSAKVWKLVVEKLANCMSEAAARPASPPTRPSSSASALGARKAGELSPTSAFLVSTMASKGARISVCSTVTSAACPARHDVPCGVEHDEAERRISARHGRRRDLYQRREARPAPPRPQPRQRLRQAIDLQPHQVVRFHV